MFYVIVILINSLKLHRSIEYGATVFCCVQDVAQLYDVASGEVNVITSVKTIQRRSERIYEGFNRYTAQCTIQYDMGCLACIKKLLSR